MTKSNQEDFAWNIDKKHLSKTVNLGKEGHSMRTRIDWNYSNDDNNQSSGIKILQISMLLL